MRVRLMEGDEREKAFLFAEALTASGSVVLLVEVLRGCGQAPHSVPPPVWVGRLGRLLVREDQGLATLRLAQAAGVEYLIFLNP